jgi:hypothetical protein
VELRKTTKQEIAGLRAAKQSQTDLQIVPGFYAGLAGQADAYLIVERPAPRGTPAVAASAASAAAPSPDAGSAGATPPPEEATLGYALLLSKEHDGHKHTTLVELGLGDGHRDRYEDVLDLLRDKAAPTAYLVRTDDCRLNATLLARGLQVEASALIMVPEESGGGPAAVPAPFAAPARREAPPGVPVPAPDPTPGAAPRWELAPLTPAHLPAIVDLLPDGDEPEEPENHHHHGPTAAETLDQVRGMAEAGEGWVLLDGRSPQAVIARLEPEDGGHELLDFVLAQGEEAGLAWGFARASEVVRAAGRRPAAVIDALDPVRRRILRAAGYYTAAAYMVFYDPAAGRPSVPTVTLQELQGMLARKERFRLVDVMGEEHWKAGHIPGSEWIDFRGLGREARKRYKQDETLVLYCNGFT